MAKKRILITGGLGYIGSALIRNLGNCIDNNVIIVDNMESKRFPSLFNLPKSHKFKFIEESILSTNFKYLKNIDILIHLAALTNAEGSYKMPHRVEQINYIGLKKVADACLKNNVKLFFPSTTSVYGSHNKKIDEKNNVLKPQTPYANSKLKSEKYIQKLGKRGLKFVIARLATTYGHATGIHYDTAVNKFIWQAVNGKTLTVWKTALNQKRPYLYYKDYVGVINFLIEKDLFKNEVYNVASQNMTVQDLVDTIKKIIPSAKVSLVDSIAMNNLSYNIDDKKIRKLGFKPSGSIEIGIKETIDALRPLIHED